jgi:hypothetical protein
MAALNPIEDFTEKMSEEVAEGLINSSAEGMVSLLALVLNGVPNTAEKLAGACYIRSLQRPDVSYRGTWPKLDRTGN